MSASAPASAPASFSTSFLANARPDKWWVEPALIALGLTLFGAYSTWAAAQGTHYEFGSYLSPFYSPLLDYEWWPFSPAFLILWVPLGFRGTCYYYRKAYYRSMFMQPPACAVSGVPHRYSGERRLLLFQNLHRYFLYLSLVFIVILSYDAVIAFGFADGQGGWKFGIGIGSLILTLNAIFLAGFTFGCNSLRHLVGGNVDCYSCTRFGKQRHQAWRGVTFFNRHHMRWAWISLFWVGFTDLYIRLCALGWIHDLRIL